MGTGIEGFGPMEYPAILKQDGHTLYLVRETKGTRDFLKLRSAEADKMPAAR